MKRRDIILIKPKKNQVTDIDILYCNYQGCPINSLYQCSYCKDYKCMRHSKILDSNKVICEGCLNNDTLYQISEAIIINNKKEYYLYKIMNKFTKWLFSKNKIKSQFVLI